jgi:hypothetical protein
MTQPPIDRPWDPPKQQPKQPMSKQTKWIVIGSIGVVIVLVMFGVVSDMLGSGDKKSPMATATTAASSLGISEQDFVRVLGATPSGFSQARAITEGRQACDIFEAGGVGRDALSRVLDLGMTQDEAVRTVFAAVVSFCPEYELDAQR